MTTKFIFIPVVNNFHLLQKAINSVPDKLFNEYFILNNSNNDINLNSINFKQFKIFPHASNLTFKDSQNIMRKYAIDNNYDYYSFMHNDGEIIDDSASKIIQKADELIHTNLGIIFTHYDVFCIFITKCMNVVGEWGDNLWPAQKSGYYLDCDYYRRVSLSGFYKMDLENSNVLHNEPSNTIKNIKEKSIWDLQRKSVENHYIKKWGGLPGKEWLDPPFDKA